MHSATHPDSITHHIRTIPGSGMHRGHPPCAARGNGGFRGLNPPYLLHRRIVKTSGGVTYDFYYNENWQVLEVRKDGDTDPWKQYVWDSPPAGTDLTFLGIAGGRYIDAPAVRYYDSDTDGQDIATHYFVNDANMNVTALLDTSGGVVERYEYDAYGRVHFLNPDFTSKATQASAYASDILFAGYPHDTETGLYHVRFRTYHPGLGRWLRISTSRHATSGGSSGDPVQPCAK